MSGVEEAPLRERLQDQQATNGAVPGDADSETVVTPYVGVLAAARRHPVILLVPLLLIVAGAVGLGVHRSPRYKSTTHLQIGGVNLNAPGALTGFSTATASLASGYARAVYANDVILPVARRYHLSAKAVRSRVSATPIPQSPLFSITATDTSATGAITLANAVSQSLVTFIDRVSTNDPAVGRLYGQYHRAALTYNSAQIRASTAQQRYQQHKTSANFNALRDARTDAQSAQLRVSTLQAAYRDAAQGQQSPTITTLLDSAVSASSDRTRKLELLAFIGLLAGLAMGLALATARANREARRPLGL